MARCINNVISHQKGDFVALYTVYGAKYQKSVLFSKKKTDFFHFSIIIKVWPYMNGFSPHDMSIGPYSRHLFYSLRIKHIGARCTIDVLSQQIGDFGALYTVLWATHQKSVLFNKNKTDIFSFQYHE